MDELIFFTDNQDVFILEIHKINTEKIDFGVSPLTLISKLNPIINCEKITLSKSHDTFCLLRLIMIVQNRFCQCLSRKSQV